MNLGRIGYEAGYRKIGLEFDTVGYGFDAAGYRNSLGQIGFDTTAGAVSAQKACMKQVVLNQYSHCYSNGQSWNSHSCSDSSHG